MLTPISGEEAIDLYENAPCGYVTTTVDGLLLCVNETFARWMGQDKDTLLGKKLRELLTAPSRLLYETYYSSLLQVQGSVGDISLDLLRGNGQPLPILLSSVLKVDAEKRSFVNSTMFDIAERRRYERELLEAKRRADTLADVVRFSATAIITTTFDLDVTSWNAASEKLFAEHRSALRTGAPLTALLPAQCIEELGSALEAGLSLSSELSFDERVVVRIDSFLVADGLAIFLEDITEQKAARTALQEAHDRFSLVTRATSDGIWDLNPVTGELYTSAKVQAMLGSEEKEITIDLHAWTERVHPRDVERVRANMQSVLANQVSRFELEYRVRHEDDSWRWIHNRGMSLFGASGSLTRVLGSFTDITRRKFEDPLTGLHTRASLLEQIERRLVSEDGHPCGCALLFLDLDGFKRVNDGLGHKSGDAVLIEVGRRLESLLASDPRDIAARLGGDEFVVLLNEAPDQQSALARAHEIHRSLRAPIRFEGRQVDLSASIGISLSRPAGDPSEDLLRNADVAMYRAKAAGKSQTAVFTENMRRELLDRMEIESDLRHALAHGGLTLHYQPKVLLETGRVIGFEALGRWEHAGRGMIPPHLFIGIAEESDLICDIGLWTLRESLQQLSRWRRAGIVTEATTMAINLSPKQFGDTRLLEVLREELSVNALPASCIDLEVTEGVLIGDAVEAFRVLQELKAIGVGLELDDFGKGYSSLSYLHRYPFSCLKVDRSFVSGLGTEIEAPAITKSIVALGKALDLKVIAEGIETEEQAELLRAMGCPYGQGYLFSRPLPPTRLESLLRKTEYLPIRREPAPECDLAMMHASANHCPTATLA